MHSFTMRELGFPVEKEKRSEIMKKLSDLYPGDYEVVEEGDMVWVTGDLHNKFRRARITYILSGGKYGKDIQTGSRSNAWKRKTDSLTH